MYRYIYVFTIFLSISLFPQENSKVYYDSGKIKEEKTFKKGKNDKINSTHIHYSENGDVILFRESLDGQYSEDGLLYSKIVTNHYNVNGKIDRKEVENFIEGKKPESINTFYNDDGKIEKIVTVRERNDTSKGRFERTAKFYNNEGELIRMDDDSNERYIYYNGKESPINLVTFIKNNTILNWSDFSELSNNTPNNNKQNLIIYTGEKYLKGEKLTNLIKLFQREDVKNLLDKYNCYLVDADSAKLNFLGKEYYTQDNYTFNSLLAAVKCKKTNCFSFFDSDDNLLQSFGFGDNVNAFAIWPEIFSKADFLDFAPDRNRINEEISKAEKKYNLHYLAND